jgi:superfamily II DNA or RNA helicase
VNAAADAVRARIAAAVLDAPEDDALGEFTLRIAQRRTVALIRRAIERHGGALLSDAPGTGKTVVALAVASRYGDVLVAGPAAVRAQWQRSAARAGVSLRFVSLESLSRGLLPHSAALFIVDEAHHLRNPSTARYRYAAALARGAAVLLLSATPVVNRRADRDALLALFTSHASAALSASTVAEVLVRNATSHAEREPLRLADLASAADVPELAELIRTLPSALPAADGRAASALVTLGLAMAWASSLAALDAALRRREQRGRALADGLAAGRWPTRDALRSWVLGDDATQLAFDLVTPAPPGVTPAIALPVLHAHLAAVRALREAIAAHVTHDTATRARALESLLASDSSRRVLVLAHHAETVRTLYRAMKHLPGIVAITGTRVLAASGSWSRAEVLAQLGAGAAPYRTDDPRGIRLLIATDLLAEGVELQGCATLVHGDPTWTPARLEQREGRVLRDGQCQQVRIARFTLPDGIEPLLALRERLAAKRRARVSAAEPADAARTLRATLARWLPAGTRGDHWNQARERLAAVRADASAFLAVVRVGDEVRLIGGITSRTRWRVTADPTRLLALVQQADGAPAKLRRSHVDCVRRVLRRWWNRRAANQALRGATALDEALAHRLRRRLDAALAAQPLSVRAQVAAPWAAMLRDTLSARGIGHAREVQRLLRDATDDRAFIAGLGTLTTKRPDSPRESGRLSLTALLVLVGPTQPPPCPPGNAARSRSAANRA